VCRKVCRKVYFPCGKVPSGPPPKLTSFSRQKKNLRGGMAAQEDDSEEYETVTDDDQSDPGERAERRPVLYPDAASMVAGARHAGAGRAGMERRCGARSTPQASLA